MPTIRDVAREAGVSVTAASRALNGRGELSPEKRARVLEAAARLNFVPSAVARALVSGKTKTLGMVITDNASPVYADIVKGVEAAAKRAGFGILLCNSADSQDQALACLALFQAKQVDGVLLTPVQSDRRDIEFLQQAGIPHILLLRHFGDPDTDAVITDNVAGGRLATNHLIELGHTRIAHIAGPAHTSSAQGRLAGYLAALGEHGLASDPALIRHAPYTIEGGYQAALPLLSEPDRPTAIFAANDLIAIGVMKAARELGLRIPDDLALVGGDNIELAEYLAVPLTTFRQPAWEIGAHGAELLLARLRGEREHAEQVVLPTELIVRASSGGPR